MYSIEKVNERIRCAILGSKKTGNRIKGCVVEDICKFYFHATKTNMNDKQVEYIKSLSFSQGLEVLKCLKSLFI